MPILQIVREENNIFPANTSHVSGGLYIRLTVFVLQSFTEKNIFSNTILTVQTKISSQGVPFAQDLKYTHHEP